MKRFYFRENKDSGNVFLSTLLEAGYERIQSKAKESGCEENACILNNADFLVMDHDYAFKPTPEWSQYFTPQELAKRPLFIYPHTPYSWFLWDGILDPKEAACNFVVSAGAKEAMQLYGYPRRVEVVGCAGIDIKPFKPTQGTRLLFAPAHPLHNSKYPMPEGLNRVRDASYRIIQFMDMFESVTVRYSHTLEESGLEAFKKLTARNRRRMIFENVDVYQTPNIRKNALEAISKADLVISQSTFGYLAVAAGKPTIFYGYKDMTPFSREGYVKHYDLYKHIFDFPLHFEDMSARDVFAARAGSPAVEKWKWLNIGENFCKEKFLSVIREYV